MKIAVCLMQLHLMLKIFVNDAWLAPWIFFENIYSEFFGMTLKDVYNMQNKFYLSIQPYKKNILCMSSKPVANREC